MTEDNITLSVEDGLQVTVTLNAIRTVNYVDEDEKFYLDGASGTTYFIFNSTTQKVEIFVKGTKKGAWG